MIYGWGMEEHDLHLLIRMAGIGIQRVAVSIFKKDEAFSKKLINKSISRTTDCSGFLR
ncbi:DUF4917 family protein [Cronobacter sakazakii]|nr:DUF4917 family protein [Cronobacter sakazakii]